MNGFISKYGGEEIEAILDKADSIKVGLLEEVSAQPFNTITVSGVTYKIPTGQQLGLYEHNIRFSIGTEVDADALGLSIDDGDNVVKFNVFTTSNTPLYFNNVFDIARALTASKIVYDKRTSPKTIYSAIMVGWRSLNNSVYEISFLCRPDGSRNIDTIIDFYAVDFSDTVVEVVAN